jgi:hypothetical protein
VPRVLRLFRFKPATPQFDEIVRGTLLPDLGRLPGLLDMAAGRRVSRPLSTTQRCRRSAQ